jgi:dTMP kinase
MFDGPEWVGKTTQVKLAVEVLRDKGYKVHHTRINGGTPIGEALRKVFLDPALPRPPKSDLHIMVAVYYALIEDLLQRRAPDTICLVDRSPFSFLAYNVYGGGVPRDEGQAFVEETLRLFDANLIICYTAPEETLQDRRKIRGGQEDIFERQPIDFMRRVVEGYQEATRLYKPVTIEASGSVEAVHTATMAAIESKLSELGFS